MAKQGRGSEQAMIRLPDGMRDQLKALAEQNGRSMNAEIVDRLEKSLDPQGAINELISLVGDQSSELKALQTSPIGSVLEMQKALLAKFNKLERGADIQNGLIAVLLEHLGAAIQRGNGHVSPETEVALQKIAEIVESTNNRE